MTCEYLAAWRILLCFSTQWALRHSISILKQTKRASEGQSEVHVKGKRVSDSPPGWVYAHAAPLVGDHTTAVSGTLWRNTLRLMLARAKSVALYCRNGLDLENKP